MATSLASTEKVVSAAEANREFSRILREVRDGRSFVVTSHGRPVARITPVSVEDGAVRRARSALLRRLEAQDVVDIGGWTRAELYEDSLDGEP